VGNNVLPNFHLCFIKQHCFMELNGLLGPSLSIREARGKLICDQGVVVQVLLCVCSKNGDVVTEGDPGLTSGVENARCILGMSKGSGNSVEQVLLSMSISVQKVFELFASCSISTIHARILFRHLPLVLLVVLGREGGHFVI
jgi:hypothetical protein